VSHKPETPFDSIEGAHQFVELLLEAIEEAKGEVAADLEAARNRADRRQEALQIVSHKLERLGFHITRSRRILNDLRILRRLLLQERETAELRKPVEGESDVDRLFRAAGAD
jgi:hypothetical protein